MRELLRFGVNDEDGKFSTAGERDTLSVDIHLRRGSGWAE